MPEAKTIFDLANVRLAQAQETYIALSGGQSACLISKKGLENEDLKRAEGAMIALREVIRALSGRAAIGNDPGGAEAIRGLLATWADLPEHSPGWSQYKSGGIQALERLLSSTD